MVVSVKLILFCSILEVHGEARVSSSDQIPVSGALYSNFRPEEKPGESGRGTSVQLEHELLGVPSPALGSVHYTRIA